MKNNKDYWKDEVMQSINGLQQAEPNVVLWAKLENRLLQEPIHIKMVLKSKLWAVTASIIFLLGINIFFLVQNNPNKPNKNEILVHAYQLYTNPEIQIP
jgi:hypothetical protein